MGAKIGPSVACLTVNYIDDCMLEEYNNRHLFQTLHWRCFRSFLRQWSRSSWFYISCQELPSVYQVHQISTSIHYKPTDSHSYLRFQSSHPPTCKKGIIHIASSSVLNASGEPKDFDRVCEDMTGFFHERGYPPQITQELGMVLGA